MRPELERLLLIEQQLLNGPAALAPDEWRLRLLVDGDLAADTATQRRIYTGLRAAGRRQLRQEIAAIHARLYGPPTRGLAWPRRVAAWLQAHFFTF